MYTNERIQRLLDRSASAAAQGNIALARQRLLSGTSSLEVRAELVRLARLAGDPADAGRWGLLIDAATDDEIHWFGQRYGHSPESQLNAVRWWELADEPTTALARLTELADQSKLRRPTATDDTATPYDPADRWLGLGCAVVGVAVVGSIAAVFGLGIKELGELIGWW